MIVGLTGGIGSGKSIVARVFGALGCVLFNTDEAAREIYFDAEIKVKVIALLGQESYSSERELNKSFISSKIFSDTDLLHRLNSVIHPAVKKKFEKFVQENKGSVIIKESALLFEANLHKSMDAVIMVTADDELRIQRVMQRDGSGREDVIKKIKSQLPQEEKIKLADYIIYNNEKEFVITQVLEIYNKLKDHA
ncbi:MAG: dephospho-CoA kinase [Bacteroidia bacterium]